MTLTRWQQADPLIVELVRQGVAVDQAEAIADRAAVLEHDAGQERHEAVAQATLAALLPDLAGQALWLGAILVRG